MFLCLIEFYKNLFLPKLSDFCCFPSIKRGLRGVFLFMLFLLHTPTPLFRGENYFAVYTKNRFFIRESLNVGITYSALVFNDKLCAFFSVHLINSQPISLSQPHNRMNEKSKQLTDLSPSFQQPLQPSRLRR